MDTSSQITDLGSDSHGSNSGTLFGTMKSMSFASLEKSLPWVARAGWVFVLAFGWSALDQAVAGSDGAVRSVALAAAAGGWLVGLAGLALLSVTNLTLARISVPVALPALAWVALVGDDTASALIALVAALVTVVALFTAETARAFVQASAYGAEERFPLRAPVAFVSLAIATWAVVTSAWLVGPMALADQRWIVGAGSTVLAIAGTWFGWQRWHRLSRRWLVVVPVGLVIHDHLVLAETLMLRRQEIAGVHLAPADTRAADLTGLTTGFALEVQTAESVTAILAATPSEPHGKAIHLTAALVSPSRPGAALAAIRTRNFGSS